MPSPIELALSTLLPTVNFLPDDLIALANSLLSQSRAKAASLKPEEEIGRTYACAHIACERLKKRLDLEVDKPKPPCPPKIYKKLYAYLDSALATPQTPKTARKRDALAKSTGRGSGKTSQAVGTPTRADGVKQTVDKTPTTGTKRSRDELGAAQDVVLEEGVPAFAMPMIRAICKATSTPKVVPHVLVGAGAVVKEIVSRAAKRATDSEPSAKRRRRTPQSAKSTKSDTPATQTSGVALSQWPALLIALHSISVARMRGVDSSDDRIKDLRSDAVQGLQEHAQADETIPPDVRAKINNNAISKAIDFYLLEAEDCGWLDMDWYRNIPEASEDFDQEEEEEEANEDTKDEDPITPRKLPFKTPLRRKEKHGGKAAGAAGGLFEEGLCAAGLLPGLGTMFQPAIDWLSEERQADFARWKKNTLKEIAAVEAKA